MNKSRILYILKYLWQNTDDEHYVATSDILTFLKENNIRLWISGYAYFINGNSPVDDDCVINDIDELDRIIHTPGNKFYDERLIHKVIKALK